ncbi:MAG: Do family serine endopeptidase [Alphaproteobacteria bacterium]|nr:Do family serine endopeptidase [Alphaproteobacteria bacterium]
MMLKKATPALLLSFVLNGAYAASPRQPAPTPAAERVAGNKPEPMLAPDAQSATKQNTVVGCPDLANGFAQVAEGALPAVVNVATTQIIDSKDNKNMDVPRFAPGSPFEEFFREFFDQMEKPRRVQSLGSGFVIYSDDQKSFIVTNYHVIADAKKISIFLHKDTTEIEATVHAYDERTDIAVLRVDNKNLPKDMKKLPALSWGDSDATKVGHWALAIGNPFGLGSTVTAGIISGKGRELVGQSKGSISNYVDDFIQHSAPINMGNSGGCLLNVKGEVTGINTAIFSPSGGNVGIGFAIPSNVAKTTVDQLIEFGRTKRGWLGVRIQHLTEEMAESLGIKTRGAIIGSVTPGGPADAAGILSGDVVIEFDGKPINENNRLSRLVGETPMGKTCKVKVWRKGQEVGVEVKIAEFEEAPQKGKIESDSKQPNAPSSQSVEVLGMQISPIPENLKKKQEQKPEIKGVLVTKIDPSSPAIESGLAKGEIIVEANQKEINTPKDLADIIEDAKKAKRKNILLLVNLKGEPRFVTLRVEADETDAKKATDSSKPDIQSKQQEKTGESMMDQKDSPKQPITPEHPANAPAAPAA